MAAYARAFTRFLGCCDQRSHMFQWMAKNKEIFKNTRSMLSIGSGTGECEKELVKHMPNLRECTFIEPNDDLLCQLHTNMADRPSKVRIRTIADTYENAQIKDNYYDMTVLFHSMYYITDREGLLKSAVRQSGNVLIVNETRQGISDLRMQFPSTWNLVFPDTELERIIPPSCEYFKTITPGSFPNDPDVIDDMLPFLLNKEVVTREERDRAIGYLRSKYGSRVPQPSAIFLLGHRHTPVAQAQIQPTHSTCDLQFQAQGHVFEHI
jgi:hypothetical protein